MKKKIILGVVGVVIVMSLLTGRSKSDSDGGKKENGSSEMVQTTEDKTVDDVPVEATEKAVEATTEQAALDETVTPDFKEAMDSYEEFFDEYVEFMKKYSDSDDTLGMLEEYSEYMTSYAEMMEKINRIDTEELSAADYAYYVEVTARIQKKLLEISG